jgi:hypothetical protein
MTQFQKTVGFLLVVMFINISKKTLKRWKVLLCLQHEKNIFG